MDIFIIDGWYICIIQSYFSDLFIRFFSFQPVAVDNSCLYVNHQVFQAVFLYAVYYTIPSSGGRYGGKYTFRSSHISMYTNICCSGPFIHNVRKNRLDGES